MDGGDSVEGLDHALLELLERCSEPAGVADAEKADLQKVQRDQWGDAWEAAAEAEDRMDARLMLLNEAEKLLRKQLRDGLNALLSAAQDQEQEASLPPPPPSPPPP